MEFKFFKIKSVGFLLPKKTNISEFGPVKNVKFINGTLSEIVNDISAVERISFLVYGMNDSLVISSRLADQLLSCQDRFEVDVAAIFTRVAQKDGVERSCIYAQETPRLPSFGQYSDIVNAGYDLCILNLKGCFRLLRGIPAWINHSFNSVVINQAQKNNLYCKFDSAFIASCKSYNNPDEILAINELMKSRNLLNVKSYYTMAGVGKLISEAVDEQVVVNRKNNNKFSIIIRTKFQRNELLERALASLYFSKIKANVEIETILVSDDFSGYPKKFVQIEKMLNIVKVKSQKTASIPSRTLNIVNGVNAVKGDYVSFLDDDDYVDVDYFSDISKRISSENFDLLFFSARALKEKLSFDGQRLLVLSEERVIDYLASDALSFARGVNMTPVSAFSVRSSVIKQFIAKDLLKHDLSEDYTLLIGLLCSDLRVSILNKILNYISLRDGDENTVTQVDRTKWLRDISDHLSVLYSNTEVAKRLNFYAELSSIPSVSSNKFELSYKKLVESL